MSVELLQLAPFIPVIVFMSLGVLFVLGRPTVLPVAVLNSTSLFLLLLVLFQYGRWDTFGYSLKSKLLVLSILLSIVLIWKSVKRFGWVLHTPSSQLVAAAITPVFFCLMALYPYSLGDNSSRSTELFFPLQGTKWAVVHGGSSIFLNHHLSSPAQSSALDIIVLDDEHRRSESLFPTELQEYSSFGVPVQSPCSGVITAVQGSLPDLNIADRDELNPTGNYVTIGCKGVSVLLAHLKQGSLQVITGETIVEGQVVGQIGNSGNTTEPHLHVQAIFGDSAGQDALIRYGEPVTMTFFGGRSLIRNNWYKEFLN